MARKRLNKKVALIGSVVFAFLALAVIGVVLYLSRDAEKFIKDGEIAIKSARAAADEEEKKQQYEKAERNYHKALSLTKTDQRRIEMLFKLVDFYIETGKWRNVLGCWNRIISIDPKNAQARYGRLRYMQIMGDSGLGVWPDVQTQAGEFIDIAEERGLLGKDTSQWEVFESGEKGKEVARLGPYLYLLRGRAAFEIARRGSVTDRDESLARATGDLERVLELDPCNIDAYWYLAQAVLTEGEILASRGEFDEREKARDRAVELLEQSVEAAGNNPRARINFLKLKMGLAQRRNVEEIRAMEPEFLSVIQQFSSYAEAYSSLCEFYQLFGVKYLDEAIDAIQRAIELDKQNVGYAIVLARLYYRQFCIYGHVSSLSKAVETAKHALTFPDAQIEPGPRQTAKRRNKILLYLFLSNCYTEQLIEPCEVRAASENEQLLKDAEQAVHEVEQLFGSGEEPQVVSLQGLLDLAKSGLARGDRNAAIRKLYAAYEQLKASGQYQQVRESGQENLHLSKLAYRLAKAFENTPEIGAVQEFLTSALDAKIGWTNPEAVLDYAECSSRLNNYGMALRIIDFYEKEYWTNERSQTLRIRAHIGARQLAEAEVQLAKLEPDDTNTLKLNLELIQERIRQSWGAIQRKALTEGSEVIFEQLEDTEEDSAAEPLWRAPEGSTALMKAELMGYREALCGLVERLLAAEPNAVNDDCIRMVCRNLMDEGKKSELADFLDRVLEEFPTNTTALFYKQMLSEPQDVSQERRKAIEKSSISALSDPIERVVCLGIFHQKYGEPNEAAAEFRKVLEPGCLADEQTSAAKAVDVERTDFERVSANRLFDIALVSKDWKLAGQIIGFVRRTNFDGCEGNLFGARLAMSQNQYTEALAKLNECLKQRPVFSQGLILRSSVNSALGNEHASLEDAQKAAYLNPLDGRIAQVLAIAFYERNLKLGDNVSPAQKIEARVAFEKAIARNPGNRRLLSRYAEFISEDEPARALAIRQRLQKARPSVENALLLGRMAMRMAIRESNKERKDFLLGTAAASFEQAAAIEHDNEAVLEAQAEYYRYTGQEEKAEALLSQFQEARLLWRHYYRAGRFADANEVLRNLYDSNSTDSDVLRGLLLVAEKKGSEEGVKKYSEELISVEQSIENHLLQIQALLRVALISEAELKLESFREKYPDEPRALLLEAWLAMKQGKLDKSLELANRSLQINQDSAVAWRLRGEAHLFMAQYEQAISDLKRGKTLSEEPEIQVSLAKAYARAGRVEDAIIELKSAIANPHAPTESMMLLEQIYWQLGRKDALSGFYSDILKRFPDSVLWYNHAASFARAAGDLNGSEQLYRLAWEKSQHQGSSDAEALEGYLGALLLGGKLDKLFDEGRRYVESQFAPVVYSKMAEAKLRLGNKTEAIEYFRKAIDKSGTNEALVVDLLRGMYSLLGRDEVWKICQERLRADPNSLSANIIMLNMTKMNGEYNKALDYVNKCLQIIGPEHPQTVEYRLERVAVLQLAYSKTSDKKYLQRAIEQYESLLAEMPNNTSVLNNLAYMLAENNERLAEALSFGERAYQTRRNDPSLLDTYGYVLFKNGQFERSAENLQAAVQLFEQNHGFVPAEVYEHLGMTKEALNATSEALAAYRQALESGSGQLSEAVENRINSAVERLELEESETKNLEQ